MVKVILSGSRNIIPFNSPRHSVHKTTKALPFSLRKFWTPLDGIDVASSTAKNFQLIHSFNRIPFTKKPWLITFESELPRTFGSGKKPIKRVLRKKLLEDNCKKIVAMSDFAKKIFISFNNDLEKEHLARLIDKLIIIHPNVEILVDRPKTYQSGGLLNLVFIGNDFARKGGISVLRLAKKASDKKLPVVFNLVSSMKYGSGVYTDYPENSKYEEDLKLLNLDNINFHQNIKNEEVLDLLTTSHFQIMPSLHDTYGFSIIEGYSLGTPAITTNVCALPEINHHDRNGYVINLKTNEYNCWNPSFHRGSQEHWDILDRVYEDLADRALEIILKLLDEPENYERLSQGAISQVLSVHDSQKAGNMLDRIYSQCVNT